MQGRYLVLQVALLGTLDLALLAGAPASAQPFLFPLEPQPKAQPAPAPSAPPVAPPQAGPSLPPSTGFAARPTGPGQQEEEAYQPPAPETQSPAPPR